MNAYPPIDIEILMQFPHINDVQFLRGTSKLVWLENLDGSGTIAAGNQDATQQIISSGFNVHGGIGYGGGAFDSSTSFVVFSDKSGRLLKTGWKTNPLPIAITPKMDGVGSPKISPDEKWVLFIAEDHGTRSVAITASHGFTRPHQLAMGADFYMQPSWHPSGERIAWVEWDHPHMPWDASRVKIGSLAGMQRRLDSETWIGGDISHPASQPRFSPDGHWLSYIQRNDNWDDLILYDLEKKSTQTILRGNGFHLKLPEWVQGMRSYGWDANSEAIYHLRYAQGQSELWRLDIHQKRSEKINIEPVSWATQLCLSHEHRAIAFLGSSFSMPQKVCLLSKQKLRFLNKDKIILPKVECRHLSFETAANQRAYGLFFPPMAHPTKDPHKPPLILSIHSGPTSLSSFSFSRNIHFFTSRGFAFAMLNYRGSSGYGYHYQDALRHQWGVVDVQDAAAFARKLINEGWVDAARMAIMGSSAGGFTVLNTLIEHPHLFKVGICSYGVSNLVENARNTHPFEKHYHQFLVGNLEDDFQRFVQRSPIQRIEKIVNPVLLFHGGQDRVVDIEETKTIYRKLQQHAVPTELIIYEDEGHHFQKEENVRDYYQRIEKFLANYLNKKPED